MTPREALSSLSGDDDEDGRFAQADAFFSIFGLFREKRKPEPHPPAADVAVNEPEPAHGILAPLLDATEAAERRGHARGVDDALYAAKRILEQVAEARGTSAYDVLREVHEGLTAVRVGLRRDVVSGLKDED